MRLQKRFQTFTNKPDSSFSCEGGISSSQPGQGLDGDGCGADSRVEADKAEEKEFQPLAFNQNSTACLSVQRLSSAGLILCISLPVTAITPLFGQLSLHHYLIMSLQCLYGLDGPGG